MASDQQVALARSFASSSTNLSRATRQVVPPFLQKLYEMVSDPTSDELIKWSDQGDSFFVFDQERFAREVLGRWFKHNKFTSFVRQLNMYGFHKIPHLQQGVLKSENETEMWNFEHPNFHRGQADLLCLIQRKKAAEKGAGDDAEGELGAGVAGMGAGAAAAPAALTSGQLIDINSIVNGITAIKRHQTAISSDLNELKNSNTHFWQEAIAARDRHKKHQDTINRILKFLAGVFGQNGTEHRRDSPGNVIPRKRQRLMIEDAKGRAGKGAALFELPEEDTSTDISLETPTMETPQYDRFASVETATPAPPTPAAYTSADGRPSSTASTSKPTPSTTTSAPTASAYTVPPPPPLPTASHSESANLIPNARNSISPVQNPQATDAALQAALSGMLEANQLQKLMAALQAQPAFQMPPDATFPSFPQDSGTTPYQASGLGLGLGLGDGDHSSGFHPSSSLALPSTLKPEDTATYQPLLENTNQLQKSVKNADAIGQEMNAMESSINSLIESLGLDPNSLQTSNGHTLPVDTGGGGVGHLAMGPGDFQGDSSVEFDFESFLHDYANGEGAPYTFDDTAFDATAVANGVPLEDNSSAFVDEVASNASTSSPGQPTQPLPRDPLQPNTTGSRKRKSGASDLAGGLTDGPSPSKVQKRKR